MRRLVGASTLVGGLSTGLFLWACSSPEHELLRDDSLQAGDDNVVTDFDEGCLVGQGGSGIGGGGSSLLVGELTEPERRPPALSGGTLIAAAHGTVAVAADPDRDRAYFVDVSEPAGSALLGEVVFPEGAEPGRLVEDDAGRVHVVLRGTGQVASIELETREVVETRDVCTNPRGIAFDGATGSLHVACAEGLLKSLPAAGGGVTRVLNLGHDLRDVIVQGDDLLVSRFRSAELLRVSSDNEITATMKPGDLSGPAIEQCQPMGEPAGSAPDRRRFEPAVAWRTIPLGSYQALMVHQREQVSELVVDHALEPGYSGSPLQCLTVVQSVVSVLSAYGDPVAFPSLPGAVLPVDVALSQDQASFAVIAAGSSGGVVGNVFFQDLASYVGSGVASQEVDVDSAACREQLNTRLVEGQPTSVTFLPDGRALVLSRQPAKLYTFDTLRVVTETFPLSDIDVSDTGHTLFHLDAGGGIACASCHPEAGDDGHVWSFAGVGPRRTQNVRGGILGSEPLHWEGDMADFGQLVQQVMVGRMGGPSLGPEYIDSLAHWIDEQPTLRRGHYDEEAALRGQALFESDQTGCATCHSGPRFTNDLTVDVGTGLALQVPSLTGVSFRGPYMHDGCAKTLFARFGECGGGDLHGKTSQLSEAQVADLVEYLKTL